ncbi:MAG: STAS domain-containing protein [Planctomycetota bacterium]|nr:STAS domain-containing protein [Planctomycetota bacterium]
MSDPEHIEVAIDNRPDGAILRPVGDIDLSRSPSFRERLRTVFDRKPKRVVVDLHDVPYMDSSGVATLVEALQIARRARTPLVLVNLQDKVRSVFEIARLDSVFDIAQDVDSALTR